LKKLRGFLGLTRYYCKFFKNYGQIATSQTQLLKQESFSWAKKATKLFEEPKEALCTTLILVTLNFTKIFIMKCDASGHGIGVVLIQEEIPLVF